MSRDAWETEEGGPDDVRGIVAASVREFRSRHKRTRDQVAAEMQAVGIGWTRDTVANTERGLRPLELSELLALAAIFRVPVVDLVAPSSSAVDYEIEANVSRETVRTLVAGPAGDDPDEPWPPADELLAAWQRED